MVDSDAQTSQTVMTDGSQQTSLVPTTSTIPIVCYLPRVASKAMTLSSELLKDNDEITKFYTGLPSWKVFDHLVCFLSTCCPNLSSSRTKVSPSNGVLLTLMRLRLNLRM